MSIAVMCQNCGKSLKAPEQAAGKAVRCPQCATVVRVPISAAKAETTTHRPQPSATKAKASTKAGPRPRPAAGRRNPTTLIAIVATSIIVLGGIVWMSASSPPASPQPAVPLADAAPATDAVPAATISEAVAPPAPAPTPAPQSATSTPTVAVAPAPLQAATNPSTLARVEEQRLFLAGSTGMTRFRCALALPDGDLLVGGTTDDLSWTGSAQRTAWTATLPGGGGMLIPFVLRLSGDLTTIRRVYHLPQGSLQEIQQLHSTGLPGQTGTLYASGGCEGLGPKDDGYVVMRLDGDDAGLHPAWATFVKAPASQAGGYKGEGTYKEGQRWDVRNDGQVIAASGCAYDFGWAELQIIDAQGRPGKMPAWTTKDGRSFLALKAGSDAGLRSKTQEDFDHRQEDENGNPGRKGRWPDDYYFQGPGQRGPGYTGYRTSDKPTQRIGNFAIDRRNNHLYFGYSTQTRLPGGNPDFEPAIVAMDDQGGLKWWARGYKEIERIGENAKKGGDAINSPPDQYIDHVAIDYTDDSLVVLARCHGNGVINYWAGNEIRRNTGRPGFQQRFTGQNGNIHISWIGRYGLQDGAVWNATYMAEFNEGTKFGKTFSSGPLAGWPDPNAGWPNVNSTRTSAIAVDQHGRTAVLAVGRRPLTTTDALIPNLKPEQGVSAWSPFARVYEQDLGAIAYSTILRGPWDPTTGKGQDDNVDLEAVVPLADGILVVGTHRVGKDGGVSDLPTTGVPAWATKRPPGATSSGLIAVLRVPTSGTP
jgi:phage FluMu protein Com